MEWSIRRHKVIETQDKLVNSYSCFLPPNLLKFLRSLDNNRRSLDPTKFYIMRKIHKSPTAGRPIVASHSYITRSIRIFADELVKSSIAVTLASWSNVWRQLSYLTVIAFSSRQMCYHLT